MKAPRSLLAPVAGLLVLLLSSCGPMKDFSSVTGEQFGRMGGGIGRVAQVARDPFGPRIAIVEAREKDLRETPSGHEQALAFERRRRGFWFFGGPVDFTEPELPDAEGVADGGLLPPIE